MASFESFLPHLQRLEAGYQNLAGDSGNYNSLNQRVGTNYGISARFYEDVLGRPPSVADMKAITKTYAKALFKKYFWDDVHGDLIANQSIADIITDHDVNAGERAIGNIVQRILKYDFGKKDLKIDGDIGPMTVKEINAVDQRLLFEKIKQGREQFYEDLGGQFLDSWLYRLETFVYSEKKR